MQYFTYKYWSTTQTKEGGGNFDNIKKKYKKYLTLNPSFSLEPPPPGGEFSSPLTAAPPGSNTIFHPSLSAEN